MDFTADEKQTLIALLIEGLAYYHETLSMEHSTVSAAMDVFDKTPEVTALIKLDPQQAADLRVRVQSDVACDLGED